MAAQRVDARPPLRSTNDTTFGLYRRQDGHLSMGNKAVRFGGKTLIVDELIINKHPRPNQWKPNDYQVYKSLVAQTKVKSFPNRTDGARLHTTWKWKYMLKKMAIPGERIAKEESEDTDDTDSVPDTVAIGDIDILTPPDSDILSPDTPRPRIPSPAHTRSSGKAKKTKDREPFL